ncbi:MAG TPA: extensin family protein [Dokdonella sp.]
MRRLPFVASVAAVVLAAALVPAGQLRVPPRWNPWAPLDVAEPPNLLTRFKLARLERDAGACLDVLRTTPMRFRVVPDRDTGPGCGFHGAVSISSAEVPLAGGSVTLTCPLAVSLALWERHVVEPAAQRRFGVGVARIEHFGSYACRNLYGREAGARSEHATANALDVAGFALADGRRVLVARDWHGDAAAAGFLHDVDADACRYFDAVLGPDYNAAHRDHLHLDRGPYRVCR